MINKRLQSRSGKLAPLEGCSASAATGERWTLEAVGISRIEEQTYELLLLHPGTTVTRLVDLSGFSRYKVQRLLDALEISGMASHSPERQRRYFPTPPDVAIEALIAKREEELKHTRVAVARLQAKVQSTGNQPDNDERVVEIITGRAAQAEIYNQIQRAAQNEVICFDRPPYMITHSGVNEAELEIMARGVHCRGIYDRSAVAFPGASERIRACMEAGEESRVFHAVPLKLIGADHRIVMLPLNLQHLDGAALLVRSSSLLDALYELFEVVWGIATPISFAVSGAVEVEKDNARNLARAERLVPLLAAGLNDKTIAAQLGISHRTLDRHMRGFIQELEARTRFQAGWQAAHRFSPRLQ